MLAVRSCWLPSPFQCQVLQKLRAETVRAVPAGARMQISPEQGQLMALLVEAVGARRAIEVGTFTGYSSIAIAQVRLAHQICDCILHA